MSNSNENWHAVETYKSLMQYGGTVLRFVLLVNGGAALALLTFLGNAVTKSGANLDFRWPMACYLIGVIIGGLATCTAYVTQLALFNEEMNRQNRFTSRSHTFWLNWTIAFAVLGILCFAVGSLIAVFKLTIA